MAGAKLRTGETAGVLPTSFDELAFIDPGIPFLDDLVRSLRGDLCAVVLDADCDAPTQIAHALTGCEGLQAIHIIAHGDAGRVEFSAGALSLSTMPAAAPALARIGASLSRDGSVVLWSCDTGSDRQGVDFVAGLTQAIGARVMAATGPVGAAVCGGTWGLDAGCEAPSPRAPLTTAGIAAYAGLLAAKTWVGPGSGIWSSPTNWGPPGPPAAGDDGTLGSVGVTPYTVTLDVNSAALYSLTINAALGATLAIGSNTLNVNGGGTNTVSVVGNAGNNNSITIGGGTINAATVSLASGTGLSGFGTLNINVAGGSGIIGSGTVSAGGGILDVFGAIASGVVLSIGTASGSTLKIENTATSATGITINNANQKLEIASYSQSTYPYGSVFGNLTIGAAESITNGTIQLDPGTSLSDSAGITIGSAGTLIGAGFVSGPVTGTSTGVIEASGGVLYLTGDVKGGSSLRINGAFPSDLKLESTATATTAIVIASPNQTLEISGAGNLTIGAAESITNGVIALSGGTLNDSLGVTVGSAATLTGYGTVNPALSGTGTVQAYYGLLDLKGPVASGLVLAIHPGAGSDLKIESTATAAAGVSITEASQELEVGATGNLTIGAGQTVTYGLINIDGTLTDSAGITLGNGTLAGSGKLAANITGYGIVAIPLSGSYTITAYGGPLGSTLDILGSVSSGPTLAIGSTIVSDLKLDGAATAATAIAISSANQTLEIGAAGKLTIAPAETVTSGLVQLDGGTLTDTAGITLAGGTIGGSGKLAANIAGNGILGVPLSGSYTVTASGGTLDITGAVKSGPTLAITTVGAADLKLDGAATAASAISISSANQTLEIGAVGSLSIGAAESITNGLIKLDGGSLTDPVGITIGSGATLSGVGFVGGPIGGAGAIIATGNKLDLNGAIQGNATGVQIANVASAVLELDNSVAAGATIAFNGTVGNLKLTDFTGQTLTGFNGTVSGMHVGTSGTVPSTGIDLTGVTPANITSAQISDSSIVVMEGAVTVAAINLSAPPPANTFVDWIGDGLTGTELFLSTAACYCRGTLVETPDGEIPVEDLAIGDLVMTLSGEAQPIRWIGRRAYDGRFIAGNRDMLPIRVLPGALADGVPTRDLWVSPGHSLYVGGVLVEAKHLVNGATIVQAEGADRVEYFHIELNTHDVIFADGAPAETYIDCDNRRVFANAAEYDRLHPDDDRPSWAFCLPRLGWEDEELTEIRAALLWRAEALGHGVDCDPGLHLVIDGAIVWPEMLSASLYRFELPAGAGTVAIASRSSVPAEIDAAVRDCRRLGVAVERLVLSDGDVTVEAWHSHTGLTEGFHEDEQGHRWTTGLAQLPAALIRPFPGPVTLDVHLRPNELAYRVPAPDRAAA